MLSKSIVVRTSAAQPGVTWPLVTSFVQQWTTSPGATVIAGGSSLFHLKWTFVRSRWCSATRYLLAAPDLAIVRPGPVDWSDAFDRPLVARWYRDQGVGRRQG